MEGHSHPRHHASSQSSSALCSSGSCDRHNRSLLELPICQHHLPVVETLDDILWDLDQALRLTADWYRQFHEHGATSTAAQLDTYIADAQSEGVCWVNE